jgi:hypothetical protein
MGERFAHNCPFMSRIEALDGTQLIYYDSLRVFFSSHCLFSSTKLTVPTAAVRHSVNYCCNALRHPS